MISGYCVAGGLELALWCGLRVTGTTAIFGVFCRPLRSPIDRRRNGASTAPDRSIADDGHDPDRTSGQCGRSLRLEPDQSADRGEPTQEAVRQLAHAIASHPQVCMRQYRNASYEQQSTNQIGRAPCWEREWKNG